MGYADDDADSLELGSMPPLPRPQPRPNARSPLAVVTAHKGATPAVRHVKFKREDSDDDVETSPAPTPHAHPLRGWKPQQTRTAEQSNCTVPHSVGARGAAMMEHLRRPLLSRNMESQRLNPTFLNRDRIAAFINKENEFNERTPSPEINVVPHSTRILEARIQQAETATVVKRPLGEEELQYAATEATQLRQLGYDGIDPSQRPSITSASTAQQDSALERARIRKVKKQVDPKWLEQRNDPSLRPLGPLEREDELAFYDSVYIASTQELMDGGVLFDDYDRKNALSVKLIDWPDLARDKRGTTGLPGCCFDEWSFN